MVYINIHTSVLDGPEFAQAKPAAIATWLRLMRYCVGQENGGVIPGVKAWDARLCLFTLGVDRKDLHQGSPLWSWKGQDLAVLFYPGKQEKICLKRRKVGKTGGVASGKSRREKSAGSKAEANGSSKPEANGSDLVERKGKESKSKSKVSRPADGTDGRTPLASLEELQAYAGEHGIRAEWAQKFFETMERDGWQDKNGKPVRKWERLFEVYAKSCEGVEIAKKTAAPGGQPAGMEPGDDPAWWTDSLDRLKAIGFGLAQSGNEADAAKARRIGTILWKREKGGQA